MCLRVVANGAGSGADTHVTVGVYLMRGEYDASPAKYMTWSKV